MRERERAEWIASSIFNRIFVWKIYIFPLCRLGVCFFSILRVFFFSSILLLLLLLLVVTTVYTGNIRLSCWNENWKCIFMNLSLSSLYDAWRFFTCLCSWNVWLCMNECLPLTRCVYFVWMLLLSFAFHKEYIWLSEWCLASLRQS